MTAVLHVPQDILFSYDDSPIYAPIPEGVFSHQYSPSHWCGPAFAGLLHIGVKVYVHGFSTAPSEIKREKFALFEQVGFHYIETYVASEIYDHYVKHHIGEPYIRVAKMRTSEFESFINDLRAAATPALGVVASHDNKLYGNGISRIYQFVQNPQEISNDVDGLLKSRHLDVLNSW